MHHFKYALLIILALIQFAIAAPVLANDTSLLNTSPRGNFLSETPQFLPVDEAFTLRAIHDGNQLQIEWNIAPEYYLYRHRLKFERLSDGAVLSPSLPQGQPKSDEYFGDVEVYYRHLPTSIPATEIGRSEGPLVKVFYQGCADAGLCYPPQDRILTLSQGAVHVSQPGAAPTSASSANTLSSTQEQYFSSLLSNASLLNIVALFFVAGLALTFTPCVLPMVPIISSIVVGSNLGANRSRAFSLSLTYVLAMAFTYALAGTLTGYFGAGLNLQMQLQSPWVLGLIAALFVAFALAMFGLYELQLPSRLQNWLHGISAKQQSGSYTGVAIIGIVSSLIVSPCVSAPLAGALVYIGSSADPLLGGLALLALGLGMGLPLLLIGTFGAGILPKAGAWMQQVKVFFGVLLLAMAIWVLERILPEPFILGLTISLLVGYALYLCTLQRLFRWQLNNGAVFIGLLSLGYAILLTAGAFNGGYNPLTPIANFNRAQLSAAEDMLARFKPVANLTELEQQLASAREEDRWVMLDIYADWCVSCKILEAKVFVDPRVKPKLEQLTLLRADITRNSAEDQALLARFGLFGPPGLLFFSPREGEVLAHRIQGEIAAEHFAQHLEKLPKKGNISAITLAQE